MTLAFATEGAAPERIRKLQFAHWDRLAETVRTIFPHKTAWHLSDLCGLKVRACFKFLARESSLSSDALVCLLDTPNGPEVLAALMGDSRERWWIQFKLLWEREQTRAQLELLDKQLDDLK